jgi:hypothetical protein
MTETWINRFLLLVLLTWVTGVTIMLTQAYDELSIKTRQIIEVSAKVDEKEAEIKKLMELQQHRTDVQFDVMNEIIRGQKEVW